MKSEGQLSHKPTFKIPGLTSASGTLQAFVPVPAGGHLNKNLQI
jgi:hypothetical protein